MSPRQILYINELVGDIEFLKLAWAKAFEEWIPEFPPINGVLSDLGAEIAKRFSLLDEEEKLYVFDCIENGIKSDDEVLSTAVATGLIEALVGAGLDNHSLWLSIQAALGPESKKYALGWKQWCAGGRE